MSPRRDRTAQARLDGWLLLAERGWRLFPVRPGSKVPAIAQWSERATDDPGRLSRFFRAHPSHNAGIACGPSGLLVVDCDVAKDDESATRWRDGASVFDDLAALHGGAPATWTVATPSGGRHLYYAAPTERVLGNTSRILGPMIDTRGDGGQVLAPGSILPAGAYELIDDTEPAPLPAWLVSGLTPQPAAPATPELRTHGQALTSRQAAYVAAAVAAETERVRRAGRGGHNTAVFTAANALGQLVGVGALDRAAAEAALLAAAEHISYGPCDCTPREVAASIRSGLDRGIRNPRRLPGGLTVPPRSRVDGGRAVTENAPTRHDGADDHDRAPEQRPPLTPNQAFGIAAASWAIAARDAAIEDGDAAAAARLQRLADESITEAREAGVFPDLLAAELDYPGGPTLMLDPLAWRDPDFRPRPDLAFDPTMPATTLAEVVQWLTARLGDRAAAQRIVAQLHDAHWEHDPTSEGWTGSLSPHELEFLAQGGARPGETFDQAMERIERIAPEDLIPADLDSPVPYELTKLAIDHDRVHMALWPPVEAEDETLTPRGAARRLTEHGLSAAEAAVAVTGYLDALSTDTGIDMRSWGLDSHDVDALARDVEQAQRPSTVPLPRPPLDADESARRAQLTQWHLDDQSAEDARGEAYER